VDQSGVVGNNWGGMHMVGNNWSGMHNWGMVGHDGWSVVGNMHGLNDWSGMGNMDGGWYMCGMDNWSGVRNMHGSWDMSGVDNWSVGYNGRLDNWNGWVVYNAPVNWQKNRRWH
jgi:hypothetical protein